MRIQNLTTREERDVPFLSGVVPAVIMAATYRAEDDAYYVLDKIGERVRGGRNGNDDDNDDDDDNASDDNESEPVERTLSSADKRPSLRLLRIKLGAQVVEVARWRMQHTAVQLQLTTGAEGSLVISSSRGFRHRLTVLTLSPDSTLRSAQMLRGKGAVDLGAYLSRDARLGVILRDASGARYFQARTLAEGKKIHLKKVARCF
jgi:hypothetical protein